MTPQTKTSARRKVLIVDDEADLRTLLGQILTTHGYETMTAADGNEAIDILGKQNIDVVLLDIQMPSVNGIQVLKYMDHHKIETKTIILTGYADLRHAMEAKEFGAKDFISKPYKLEDVLGTIERVLG